MIDVFKILIVEDSETQALQLSLTLQQEGWEPIIAPTAEAALEQLNADLPDLIVVDFYLPGIRGDELCRRIRMNVNTRGIPILMLTVEEDHASELHGLESGADDYVSKSVDPEILLLRIRTLLRKSTAAASIVGATESYFHKARLLVIDDSPTYIEFLAGELSSEGYTIEKATLGKEGLQRINQDRFDCILVDLVMPEMDGIEVCRRITEMRRTLDNPLVVLMLTAHENKEDMTRGLEAGADDFVGKSSDMAVVKARIRALLRRKFFQEENQRIIEELKNKELEAVRAKAEKEVAEARAALVGELEKANRELAETNRKLKETQMHLIQSEKMASLGQLVAGIAHEINNPLTFVITNLFTVGEHLQKVFKNERENLTAESTKKLTKVTLRLQDMQEGLERVKTLVQNLRTFSRLDEGEFKTIEVGESIDSTIRILNHKIKDHIQIVKNYDPSLKLACFAGQFNQVLMNILSNAIDAIEDRGTITISANQEGDDFMLSIQDTGKGIPPEIQNRVFEPFFTSKPVGEGTGLGLSISYSIIQRHNGEITVDSKPNKGTTFSIKIPLNSEEMIHHG